MKAINFLFISLLFTVLITLGANKVEAHRSGCHRWHSCPSDSGSYTCGDAGHPCQYATYPASGGVIYPPSGYYKDCYDCPLKKVSTNDTRTFKQTMQKGVSGSDVVLLQRKLNSEGVYYGEYTGYFGNLTETAVKAFQNKYGIVNSGTPSSTGYGSVGWATLSKLNSL